MPHAVSHVCSAAMNPEIRSMPLNVTLLGASLAHDKAKPYGQEIRSLLDRVWPALRGGAVANKGINWVVYDGCDRVFAGIEPESSAGPADAAALGLERMELRLGRHAWIKHVGPYQQLGTAYAALNQAIADQGLRAGSLRIEVYGHWDRDESKLATELIVEVG